MSLTIRYGKPVKAVVKQGYGLQAFIVNLFFESDEGETSNDACLLLCRSAFSLGKSYIAVRRKQAHQLLDKDGKWLSDTAEDAAKFLWNGHSTVREEHIIMDCLLENIDELVMHKPEGEDLNRKALDRYFEGEETFTHGLMDILNEE